MKNEEYYKQHIIVLIAVANLFGFFLIADVSAAYNYVKNENLTILTNQIIAFVLFIFAVVLSLFVLIFVLKLFSTLKKLKK